MGYKCAVFGCDTGYEGGEKHPTFFFPKDTHLTEKWEKCVNRRDWKCTSYSVICAKHFEAKYIKKGEKRDKLRCELQPIPIIHDNLTTCVVPTAARKAPKERNVDAWKDFKASDVISNFNHLSPDVCPKYFTYLKQETYALMYRLVINKTTRIPVIHESIMVDESLHVSLSYLGYHVPLPEWFRSVYGCKLLRKKVC